MSKTNEYLDFNRFVGKNVFTKTTDESLFTDFEVIY